MRRDMRPAAWALCASFLLAGLVCAQDKKVYSAGGDVSAPQVIHSVLPTFTDESRKAQISGAVLIGLVVTADGNPDDVQVEKGLEKDLDETAVAAVKQWKFKPGAKAGKPVAVRVSIRINFKRL